MRSSATLDINETDKRNGEGATYPCGRLGNGSGNNTQFDVASKGHAAGVIVNHESNAVLGERRSVGVSSKLSGDSTGALHDEQIVANTKPRHEIESQIGIGNGNRPEGKDLIVAGASDVPF